MSILTKDQLPLAAMQEGQRRGRVRNIYIKNSSPIPNWYFDSFLSDYSIPSYVHGVFLYVLRRTIGWDKKSEFISYDDIENGASTSRHSVQHAVMLLCDCWGLFKFESGKGKRKSKFTVNGNWERDVVEDRKGMLECYGPYSECPTLEELRMKPCTPEVIESCRIRGESSARS